MSPPAEALNPGISISEVPMHYTAQQSTGTSARKAEANRTNAQKSTGPTSPEGKSRSAQNAKRHGLLAGAATLLARPSKELEALLARYSAELRPAGPHQEMLVRDIAVADLRIKQLDRVELGLIAYQTQAAYDRILATDKLACFNARPMACPQCGLPPSKDTSGEEEPEQPELCEAGDDMQTLLMGAAWCTNPAAFALLVRYQAQARRDYYRALKQLGQARSGKADYLPEESADQTKPAEQEVKTAATPAAPEKQKSETNPTTIQTDSKADPVIQFPDQHPVTSHQDQPARAPAASQTEFAGSAFASS